MCYLAEVSRAGFYRHRLPAAVPREELVLRDAVQRVALEWPAYGSRRTTHELQQRGWTVNQAGAAHPVRGQPALPAPPPVRSDDELEA